MGGDASVPVMRPPTEPETRTLTSSGGFFVGQVMKLRPDMGGGEWEIVELLPMIRHPFQRAKARRVK